MTAAAACHLCGTRARDGARFCDRCGAPIAEHHASAEYKQVTVLFADVVHWMDLAAVVGAERLREIMADLTDRCATAVRRYGCTVTQFTGDGIMAVFGAPVALEDHAVRACLAALGIQEEAKRLADAIAERDGVELRLRVGLNSGQVTAGGLGSGHFGYAAVGEQVGMAQRMESVAPPGGVMLSASTARLVEGAANLCEAEIVHIKGADEPVAAYRLLSAGDGRRITARSESKLVGRQWELTTVEHLLNRAITGHGAIVGVVGSPGIGKSRLVREVAALARRQNAEVFTTSCESHAADIAFHVVARLLRTNTGVDGLDPQAARARLRARVRGADPEDMALLDDLLGIADPDAALPKIDPDARRRRLTSLVNAASLARNTPTVYVIEDVHWIDAASESMLIAFLEVIPRTPSLVLITYRPEYRGALSRVAGAHTICLAPLSDSEMTALVRELIGEDPSVGNLGPRIVERAAGNPYFAEEMVRELAERGVLQGQAGAYVSAADTNDATVPATLQATIGARIDRLEPAAKRTLNAAAVIGSRFSLGLLRRLGVEPVTDDLVAAQLIDQVGLAPQPDYVFHHPLIRAVAYEAQLKSDRAELHRRVANVLESGDPATEENAALIARHLDAAGDPRSAYGWHMRAATWATNRDIAAAEFSWQRAVEIADALPAEDPDRAAMRIAPRTMLCGTAYRVQVDVAGDRFEELQQLCTDEGDKASLAIGMAGLVTVHAWRARIREASRLASESWALVESLGDPTLTVGLSFGPIYAKFESGEWSDVLRWSQRVIDLADRDPAKGNLLIGSPLALAFATRAFARYCLGHPGWRDDLRDGLAMARSADSLSYAAGVGYVYWPGIPLGVLRPDDSAMREIEDALRIAERSADDLALDLARATLGLALVHRQKDAERSSGQTLLDEAGEACLHRKHNMFDVPLFKVYSARERARCGERDEAIPLMRSVVDDLVREGQQPVWSVCTAGVLVETLLERGAECDIAEAEVAIERLAAAAADEALVMRDIWLLRLRALLARARGDEVAYVSFRDRYRDMANSLGFEGHIDWARAMV
ncbi:ATP-binding protein [Mycobacterium sp. Marseille-P9652]|uniref:ATP-binding protein n=1 Tax=Mycobacterium sp. Marseille-P9652 TaxID=2654950 RepID=UPI0012E9874F|nr:adenylate/guanylate cyclase domain-containing protein [Mycobacterium sp. Marseille-P9652]